MPGGGFSHLAQGVTTMPDANDQMGVVLFGADGSKYVIPMDVVESYRVPSSHAEQIRTVQEAEQRPEMTVMSAYHAPVVRAASAEFFFHNDPDGPGG
jgi:hypothetical protein